MFRTRLVPPLRAAKLEQKLRRNGCENRELYSAGLEILRAHIHRTLLQIAKIAEMQIPGILSNVRYDEHWQIEAYRPLLRS
jgi:hypothetical protein